MLAAGGVRAAVSDYLDNSPTLAGSILDGDGFGPDRQAVKVAFMADQGLGPNARAVLRLIRDEGADIVLHSGDLDYQDNPTRWDAQIIDVLGPNFPYLVSMGNHDLVAWDGYQARLAERITRTPGVACSGDLGVKSVCTYKGVLFILSGVGLRGSGHESFIREHLAKSDYSWRICSWHMTQRLMQVGDKFLDLVGWGAYEECRKGGAIIVTAHSHTYSRSHLLSSFTPPTLAGEPDGLRIEEGRTFVVDTSIGGASIRAQVDELASNPWWATVYTASQGATFGALFCSFFVDGSEDVAPCYLKNIEGTVVDSFVVINGLRRKE